MVINTTSLLDRESRYGYPSYLKLRMQVSGSYLTRNAKISILLRDEIWINWYMSFRVIQEASICKKFPKKNMLS